MIGQIGNLIIENYGRRVDNLVPKNTEETLLDFWLIAIFYPNLNWIIMFLLLVLVISFVVVIVDIRALVWVKKLN